MYRMLFRVCYVELLRIEGLHCTHYYVIIMQLGAGYPGSSVSGGEGGSQINLSSRHPSITGAPQETEIGGYRSHLSTASHYGTQYGSVYGSTSLSSSQPLSTQGVGSSVLENRSGYVPTLPDSPKFASGSYMSPSSHGYGQKGDDLYSDKLSGYVPVDRRQYGERSNTYLGRELPSETTARYADSSNFGRQVCPLSQLVEYVMNLVSFSPIGMILIIMIWQTDMYDRIDQASLLRGEQLLKIQSLHTSSADGGVRYFF